MLKVENRQGRTIPFLFCDACGKRIADASLAGVVYKTVAPSTQSEVLFAHKGACMDALEESLGKTYDGWDELYRYLAFITSNVKLKPSDLAAALKMNQETGI